MSISYNYFLPTNIFGTLRVTDLGFPGYTAVNANIYCQRNINCDGQMQCGQFHSLGTAYFDQVPTCITNATTATQLTNYQTVQALVAGGGGSSILGLNNTWSGTNTFQIPIVSSGASITANTIPALSIVNSSITNSQIATGFQLVSTSAQTFSGIKTFSSAIVSSGESLTANTIPALSIVNSSITNSQIATGFQLISTGNQTFSGDKTFLGSATNEMIINIINNVSPLFYSGSIAFIPACTTNYLNLTTSNFDSMMYIGQPIANGINQSYGFTICDYNSGLTGIRISGSGSAGNCNINLNGTVIIDQLMTLENGLFVNGGNISTPNNAVLGNIFSDIINNYDQTTGTDIILNPNNFVQCLVNAGNNSVLPNSVIGFGGLKIGWNCSNTSGETDFLNLANYSNAGGFNFYTMNASALPSLIGSLSPTALTITGSLTNNKIVNSSSILPYFIQTGTMSLPNTTTGDPRSGFLTGWNGLSGSNGETDFTNLNQAGTQGGFLFGNIPFGGSYQKLASLLPLNAEGLRLYSYCGQLRLDDTNNGAFNAQLIQTNNQLFINSRGINTQLALQCGNSSAAATNSLLLSATTVSPQVNFSPASTTTFNNFHPTTSLGNNLSTNTTQYATVGFVNSNSATALLASNNTWTGNNNFYGSLRYINIGSPSNALSFGASNGNSGSIIVGDSSSLATTTISSGNICIAPPLSSSLYTTTGSNNICVGALSGTAITTGNNNLIYGASSATGITTGSLNTVIGAGAWPTGNFSNCSVIGAGAPSPVANNSIILGRTLDTVYVQGASQLTNTLLIGTTVATGNMQVNGNIIQPVGTLYTATGITTFTTIPPIVLFTPIAGMSFVLPTPNGTNAGQQIIIRRIATGSNTAVLFTATGGGAVFVPLNSGTGAVSLSVLATWQVRLLCANNLYYQIA